MIEISSDNGAVFSECHNYRWLLWRTWNFDVPMSRRIAYIGLNPSTATATKNDPTMRRLEWFSRQFGYDGMVMFNLFAIRTPYPSIMRQQANPVGELNDETIKKYAVQCDKIVCCWETDGDFLNRDKQILELLPNQELHVFGFASNGQPRHPLYLKHDTTLQVWQKSLA